MLTKYIISVSLIDEEPTKFLTTKVEGTTASNPPEPIKLVYLSQMLGNYKEEQFIPKKIVCKEIR